MLFVTVASANRRHISDMPRFDDVAVAEMIVLMVVSPVL